MKRLCAILCSLMLALSLIPVQALAAEADDTVDLTVAFGVGTPKSPVSGVRFSAYEVASVTIRGSGVDFTVTEDFTDYGDRLGSQDASGWQTLTEDLAREVSVSSLTPAQTAVTDADGHARFEDLPMGLYLVVGDRYSSTLNAVTTTNEPQPFLICLPDRDEDGNWNYDVTATPKYTVVSGITRIEVVKIWNDEGYEEFRPTSVTVRLLRDGVLYDEVELTEDNGWSYEWNGLDARYSWQVEEVVPPGYVSRTQSERRASKMFYAITNTYTPPTTDIPDDDIPTTDIPDDDIPKTDIPDIPDDDIPWLDIPDDNVPLANLPQTGMLWWPVPLFATFGLLFFLIGWVRYRKSAV